MKNAIKELKRRLDARTGMGDIVRDSEGRAVIEMTVKNDEEFLSDFSLGTKPVVSTAVAEFLEENAKDFPPQEDIHIVVHSSCIDEEKGRLYAAALREYYTRHYLENGRELKRYKIMALIMALVGLFAIAAALTVSFFGGSPIASEAIDIFAWVFLWEAVDLYFLERLALKIKRTRCLHFIEAKIEFLPPDTRE